MEAGQMLHNSPVGAPCPPIADAILREIRSEIARVFWNVNQKSWGFGGGEYGDAEWYWNTPDLPENGTGIPGIAWRAYYNWGGSPDDADWNQGQANLPNFSFEGVEVRWYKRFGRSLNCNVVWPPSKWNRWFERCLQTLRAYEDEKASHVLGNRTKYPDPNGAVSLTPDEDDLRFIAQAERIRTLEAQMTCIACVCLDVENGKKPRFEPSDWRWCRELDMVTRLGIHALSAPGKFNRGD